MLAIANQPRIEIIIRAKKIPTKLMNFIRLEYPSAIVKRDADDSDGINFRELDWFKKVRASMLPSRNLKLLRKERKFSKKELSEKSGLTVALISDYECGKVKITKSVAKKLAVALDTAEENLHWQ
jgi:DNA-binding transcriptional regulator YiaG